MGVLQTEVVSASDLLKPNWWTPPHFQHAKANILLRFALRFAADEMRANRKLVQIALRKSQIAVGVMVLPEFSNLASRKRCDFENAETLQSLLHPQNRCGFSTISGDVSAISAAKPVMG